MKTPALRRSCGDAIPATTTIAAGRVWSLTIDDPPQGKRKYTTLYLEGVPPLLAETPSQLLIAKGDE